MQPQGQQMQHMGTGMQQGQQFQQAPPPHDNSVQQPAHEDVKITDPAPPIDPRTGQPMENPLRDARNGELVDGYTPIIDPNNPNGSLGSVSTQESQQNNVFQYPPTQPGAAGPAVAAAPPPPPPPGGPNGPIPPGPPKNPDDINKDFPTYPEAPNQDPADIFKKDLATDAAGRSDIELQALIAGYQNELNNRTK